MRFQSPEAVALLGLAAALGLAAFNVVRAHRPPEPVPGGRGGGGVRASPLPPREAAAGRPYSSPGSPGPSPAGEAPGTVNVNTATAADLERLPGVGPVLARRIVEFREAKGLFRRLQDLQEVGGIGPKLYRRVEPVVGLAPGKLRGP